MSALCTGCGKTELVELRYLDSNLFQRWCTRCRKVRWWVLK
jgi:hypothetical protein